MRKKINVFLSKNDKIYQLIVRLYVSIKTYNPYTFIKLRRTLKSKISLIDSSKKSIYHMILPTHGNLGDTALAVAQIQFLKNEFKDSNHLLISSEEYDVSKKYLSKIVNKNDLIILIGGGSLGNQYIKHEKQRRDIINRFSFNKIISFPQSVYFTNDEKGRHEASISKKIYNNHPDFLLCTRDYISYNISKELFGESCYIELIPDIVYSLEGFNFFNDQRKNCGIFLRDDVESSLSKENISEIKSIIRNESGVKGVFDTKINKRVDIDNYLYELNNIFEIFNECEYVVTDRLHGAIFSIISSTPVFIFENYNHKIRAQKEWLEDFEHVYFCADVEDFHMKLRCFIDKDISQPYDFNSQNLDVLKNKHLKILDFIKK